MSVFSTKSSVEYLVTSSSRSDTAPPCAPSRPPSCRGSPHIPWCADMDISATFPVAKQISGGSQSNQNRKTEKGGDETKTPSAIGQTHPLAKIRAGNGRRLRRNRRRPWPRAWVDAGTDLRPTNGARSGRPSAVRRRECGLSGAWAPCRSAAATGRGRALRNPPVSRRQTAPCGTDEITHVGVINLFICHPQTEWQSCQGYYLAPANLTAGNLKSPSNCGSLYSTLSETEMKGQK